MPSMDMHNHGAMSPGMSSADSFFLGESSGTGVQPAAWPMPMVMTGVGDWHLMWMGQAFLVDTQQTGPYGFDKLYSTNWGMLGAMHRLGGGSIMLRTMLSLEPATITDRQYPLLFQTGETAYGEPITNGQHPHDLVMELSAQYSHSVGERAVADLYYGVVGDPALGPVAYPHRASALEIPQATLGHHWEDSTHIASNVLTGVLAFKLVRFEASGFYGSEPGENRWTIYFGPMNSYSGRITWTPTARWAAQVSAGHLTHPEALEPGDVVRTTASVEYVVPRPNGNWWATSLVWGRNWKTAPHYGSNAVLAETLVPFRSKNFFTARYEWSQRDELFADNPALEEQLLATTGARWFDVSAYTIGYTRDLLTWHGAETGLGANLSLYGIPSTIQPYYGNHPLGVNVYLRVRLK
ncbi:MAG TPA: hypothetical protein VE779_07170 [Candidatus Angelobacter sp.]|nr:hypothetical protein [Candidatus Angelobacter sp.]